MVRRHRPPLERLGDVVAGALIVVGLVTAVTVLAAAWAVARAW